MPPHPLRRFLACLAALLLAFPASADTPAPAPAPEAMAAPGDADALLALAAERWTGDLDAMVARGFVRVGTVYSPLFLTYDGPEQTGLTVDVAAELEKHLRKTLGKPARSLTVIVLAIPREEIVAAVADGRIDIAMANLTITPERSEQVAFSAPLLTGVRELVVTGAAAGTIATLDDLVATGLHLRPSSSYAASLARLNADRTAAGLAPIPLHPADERLEDHDLLELVDAGVLPAVAVDDHKAGLWAQVYDGITVHEDLALAEGGEIAWAFRKDSPGLEKAVNAFVKTAKKGTLLGNTLFKRYYGSPERVTNALDPEPQARFREVISHIRTHATAYGFEPLLIAAQGYQESRLDQSRRSKAGAVGIMQLLPSTAKDPNVGIPDIHKAERNVEAGVKYLRFLRDRYFSDPGIETSDAALLSFAAYNAGPGNISKARRKASEMGLDPNVWFGNVEIATARAVSREPVDYVRRILKYYASYRFFLEEKAETGAAAASSGN
jgi:membrane-bound lytic murein transglycosylase MltF